MGIETRRLNVVSGWVGVLAYLVPATLAFTRFPASYHPLNNWLSDLGNRILNPDGAMYYRIAGILSGSALLLFFASLKTHDGARRRVRRVLSLLVRLFGGAASVCFILTGVFSEDMMPMHSWFSVANFAAFGTAIALTGVMNILEARLPAWFTLLCIAAWVTDVVSGVFGQVRWLEWAVVALLILYVGSLATLQSRKR